MILLEQILLVTDAEIEPKADPQRSGDRHSH